METSRCSVVVEEIAKSHIYYMSGSSVLVLPFESPVYFQYLELNSFSRVGSHLVTLVCGLLGHICDCFLIGFSCY